MSPTNKVLQRLQGVKQLGDGQWISICPAHNDHRPSFSIQETSDGRLLIHCFAGCPAVHVLAAIGLELRDLYPQRFSHRRHGRRPQFSARDILLLLNQESSVLLVAASDIASGKRLSPADVARIITARSRIERLSEIVR